MSNEVFLNTIREEELKTAFKKLNLETSNYNILDFGAGNGLHLEILTKIFKSATGVDIENSSFKNNRISGIIEYDGITLPFADNSFDIIFSSNTLEHVDNLDIIEKEFARILKDNGTCVIILPSHYWKIWTFLTYYLQIPIIIFNFFKRAFVTKKKNSQINISSNLNPGMKNENVFNKITRFLLPEKHGVRGNYFTEFFYFYPNWWVKHFKNNRFLIRDFFPLGIIYTGNGIFLTKISLARRRSLAKFIGSTCYAYILKLDLTGKARN